MESSLTAKVSLSLRKVTAELCEQLITDTINTKNIDIFFIFDCYFTTGISFSRAKVNKKINTTPKNEKNFGCFFFTHNKSVKNKVLIFVK